jgi:hypothetical protein
VLGLPLSPAARLAGPRPRGEDAHPATSGASASPQTTPGARACLRRGPRRPPDHPRPSRCACCPRCDGARGRPVDRGDQQGDRVLSSDRVIEDRVMQRPTRLRRQRPGGRDDLRNRIEDPVRPVVGREPARPICQRRLGQRRRMRSPRRDGQPARRLPPHVERHRIDRLAVRQVPSASAA